MPPKKRTKDNEATPTQSSNSKETKATSTTPSPPPPLRYLGLCGIDNSVDPLLLGSISHEYPFVEWGVLFNSEKAGEPRYATMEWVREKLHPIFNRCDGKMKLAAHLCGSRVNEVLAGSSTFVKELISLGFKRIQINATTVNGADTSNLTSCVEKVVNVMNENLECEFIIQRSDETTDLWEGVEQFKPLPVNMSMLFDESKGSGVKLTQFTPPPPFYDIGYAGGIRPSNVKEILGLALEAGKGRGVWIDMETGLRGVLDGRDVFDINKVVEVVRAVCEVGVFEMK